jgi:hypothetical protein
MITQHFIAAAGNRGEWVDGLVRQDAQRNNGRRLSLDRKLDSAHLGVCAFEWERGRTAAAHSPSGSLLRICALNRPNLDTT